MKKLSARFLILILISVFVLSSCAVPNETSLPGNGLPETTQRVEPTQNAPGEGVLCIGLASKINSADPQRGINALLEGISEGLLRAGESGYRNAVAESYTTSDFIQWTFTLRPDACWSDGTPIVAQDFVYSWQLAFERNMPDALDLLRDLKGYDEAVAAMPQGPAALEESFAALGVSAVDERTLLVELSRPSPWFARNVSAGPLAPIHRAMYERYDGEYGTLPENTASNGPFVISSWDDMIVLTPNEIYWDAGSISLKEVWLRSIEDETERINAFLSGEIHACWTSSLPEETQTYAAQYTGARTGALLINKMRMDEYGSMINEEISGSLTSNNLVLALSTAIDRNALVAACGDPGLIPTEFLVSGAIYANDSAQQPFGSYRIQHDAQSPHILTGDMDAAREYLDMAIKDIGYSDVSLLPSFTLITANDASSVAAGEYIRKVAKDVLNITIAPENVSADELARCAAQGDYDLIIFPVAPEVDDPYAVLSLFGQNEAYKTAWEYADPASHAFYAGMLDALNAIPEPDIRAAQLMKAEEFVLLFGPAIPLYAYADIMLRAANVSGLNARTFGCFYDYCFAVITAD